MRLARVLGAIGRALISAGVIVLLFVAYQLWGTGIQNAQAQNVLERELEESTGIAVDASDEEALIELARASEEARESGQILANPEAVLADAKDVVVDVEATDEVGEEAVADVFGGNFDEAERQAILAELYPDAGEAFARIIIPSINVDDITVAGVSVEDLRKGPGHYRTTPNPGQAGNASIAGHRTTYGAPFHRVDELKPDDSIFVTTAQGVFEYKVVGYDEAGNEGGDLGYFIVAPSRTDVLNDIAGRNTLTLTACHPKYSARQRIIVRAELVGDPVRTIPRAEASELGAVELAAEDLSEERDQITSDEVAADDDPTVDAEGNPIDPAESGSNDDGTVETASGADDATIANESAAADETQADPSQTDDAASTEIDDAATAEATEAVPASDDAALASAQTPFSDAEQDFGEGLNGDPTKVKPAIMWGLSGLSIWIAAWYMGRQLERKWTLYFAGLIPFAMVLWFTFVNVDQALPSY